MTETISITLDSEDKIFKGIFAYDTDVKDIKKLIQNVLKEYSSLVLPDIITILSRGSMRIKIIDSKYSIEWYANDNDNDKDKHKDKNQNQNINKNIDNEKINYALSTFMHFLNDIAFHYLNNETSEYILPEPES